MVYRRDGAKVVAVLRGDVPVELLQLVGDGLVAAVDQEVQGAAPLAERCVAVLRDRGWAGDEELTAELEVALGHGPPDRALEAACRPALDIHRRPRRLPAVQGHGRQVARRTGPLVPVLRGAVPGTGPRVACHCRLPGRCGQSRHQPEPQNDTLSVRCRTTRSKSLRWWRR